jgi:hypothetical protein
LVIKDVIETFVQKECCWDKPIDKGTARLLALTLGARLQVYGVRLNKDKFMELLVLKPSFNGSIAIVERLLPGYL